MYGGQVNKRTGQAGAAANSTNMQQVLHKNSKKRKVNNQNIQLRRLDSIQKHNSSAQLSSVDSRMQQAEDQLAAHLADCIGINHHKSMTQSSFDQFQAPLIAIADK